MDNLIKERDVLLTGKDENGSDTFDLPVTRLGNVEAMGDSAEIKENPDANDFIPVIDAADGEKMKKTSVGKILTPLNNHIADNVRHITGDERNAWNNKANANHSHDDRYYTESEINGKLAGKSDTSHAHDDRYYTESEINGKLAGKSDTSHAHSVATQGSAGFMSASDKAKLDAMSTSSQSPFTECTLITAPEDDGDSTTVPFKVCYAIGECRGAVYLRSGTYGSMRHPSGDEVRYSVGTYNTEIKTVYNAGEPFQLLLFGTR